jgi:3-oxoacyl-[acyl-carrier-protein] synthase II
MIGRREPVAIVGAGLKAPGGLSPAELWDSLMAGRSSAELFDEPRLTDGARVLVARVEGFDSRPYLPPIQARRLDRCHQLAVGAARDAFDSLAGSLPGRERCAVVCGVGFGATAMYETQHTNLLERGLHAMSPMTIPIVMPSSTAAVLSIHFGFRGPSLTVSTACASGTTAIGEAMNLLRRNDADLVLAGGADSMLTFNALAAFLRLDAMTRAVDQPEFASRPFDVDRDGFLMAEGAGFVVIERLGDAKAAGHEVLGLVAGYGSCTDAHHLVAPPEDGVGARRCMRLALDDAGIAPAAVNHINAHGTSTPLNDLAESRAISAIYPNGGPPVTAVKGTTGHMIGGSGAVEAIMTLWALRLNVVPPIAGLRNVDPSINVDVVDGKPRKIADGYGLSNSFGFGGANAALLLAARQLD